MATINAHVILSYAYPFQMRIAERIIDCESRTIGAHLDCGCEVRLACDGTPLRRLPCSSILHPRKD